jgi:hypothetical protein
VLQEANIKKVKIMNTFFWVVTPCSLEPARRFGGIYHFYVQDRREREARKPVEAVCVAFRLPCAGFFLGLLFDCEYGGDMLLRKVVLSPIYTEL